MAALSPLEAVRTCYSVSTYRGLQQLLQRRALSQAHNEAALEHASAWALVVSQCGALRGTRIAAEHAPGIVCCLHVLGALQACLHVCSHACVVICYSFA